MLQHLPTMCRSGSIKRKRKRTIFPKKIAKKGIQYLEESDLVPDDQKTKELKIKDSQFHVNSTPPNSLLESSVSAEQNIKEENSDTRNGVKSSKSNNRKKIKRAKIKKLLQIM